MKIKLFRKKPIEEKKARTEIKVAKKANHNGNPTDARIGGQWISTTSGAYKISYNKKGRLMTLSNLQKTGNYTSASPKELRMLLEKQLNIQKILTVKWLS